MLIGSGQNRAWLSFTQRNREREEDLYPHGLLITRPALCSTVPESASQRGQRGLEPGPPIDCTMYCTVTTHLIASGAHDLVWDVQVFDISVRGLAM